ncbi:MAG TPA: PAS domain-containing protein, partial [Rhodospirillales bacterium]
MVSASEEIQDRPKSRRGGIFHRPWLWALATIGLGAAAAYLRLEGEQASAAAVSVSGLALAALFMVAWTLGYRRGADPLSHRLHAAADDSRDGLLITGADGRFVYANLAFHRLFHAAAEAGSGGRVASLDAIGRALAGDERAAAELKRLAAQAKAGAAARAEFPIPIPSGAVEWRRLSVCPVADPPNGAMWRAEDITASREVDTVRHQQESLLADFLDLLPVGFFSADGQGRIRFANQTLGDWLGSGPEELVGKPLDEVMVGGAAPAMGDDIAAAGFRRRDGGTFKAWVAQTARADAGDGNDGAYTRSVVLRDADWRPAEAGAAGEAGAGPEIRLHWLFDEAPVGIVLLDLGGNIAECNRAFLKLVGRHPEVLIGTAFADCVSKEDRSEITAQLSKVVMGTARATHMEVRMPGAGAKELVTSIYASRLENALGELSGLAIHFIDTTEQKNLEVQFAQSQKMQAVGQLAGGVAHDFNNLLTAMIGFADLLLARHGPSDPSFADIQQIRQNANRATNLVRQLLAFSRKQTLTPERLDVADALNDLSNLLGRLIGETVDLKIEHGKDLKPVRVDRGQFDQVIVNLAVNARDAMPGGGQLTIRTSTFKLNTGVQRGHDLVPPGRYVLIEVIDTGTGIKKEDMERIFEPFFSTKEVGAGTGLGLSTVYGIVHQSGGFIFVDSAPGEGATFSIVLPEHLEDEKAAAAAKALKQAPEEIADLTGAGTVLLVEDED